MNINIFFSFVIATAIMIAMPGPSVLLTVAHSLSFGSKRALITVCGATAGIGIQLSIAAIGLVSVVQIAASIFSWIRWSGAAYLIYLGIMQWYKAGKSMTPDDQILSGKKLFVQGMVITVPNPKSLIFIAAFLPQFIDLASPLGMQLAIIIPTFLLITFTITAVWALAAGKVKEILRNEQSFKRISQSSGIIMILAGAGLALAYNAG